MEIIILIAIAGILFFVFFKKKKKTYYREEPKFQSIDLVQKPLSNLEIVSKNTFTKKFLLNKSEGELYWKLVNHLRGHHKGTILFAQVAMGEFLGCTNDDAFFKINSKRVDFLITNRDYKALAVVEYQGSGHNLKSSVPEHDAIKREVCRKAGVAFIEFKPNYDQLDFELLSKELNAQGTNDAKQN
ncbi:MAG: DUF2726 domain-containing protein [[Actinobacillus] rossii]|nr:DUF2726 domain-containing protein [[Actinobacillus] rossii]